MKTKTTKGTEVEILASVDTVGDPQIKIITSQGTFYGIRYTTMRGCDGVQCSSAFVCISREVWDQVSAEAQKMADDLIARIKSGEKKIKASYHDGEYMSGWQVFGKEAELLQKLGIAKEVDMWGVLVDSKFIDQFGEEFTYSDAEKFAAPALAEKKAKQDAADSARLQKFEEARKTGKKVVLRTWTEDCNNPQEECSCDIMTEFAMPDGTTQITRQHTF